MANPHAIPIVLSEADRGRLQGWVRRRKTGQALATRARVVLACAEPGSTNGGVAAALGVSRPTVALWRRRFAERGPEGLLDEPRPGAPRKITDEQVERAITATLEAAPADATHWSTRSLARATGLSQTAVCRIWRAFALKPHRAETFKLSKDPLFVEKVRDIVGLYLSPPDRALVLCVDEKPQVQAVERTAPVLPMRPGQPERRTHDYLRHGTTDLFAALDAKTGMVIGACHRRHRAPEFRAFLDEIDRRVPPDLEVHLVLDNLRTHKTGLISPLTKCRRPMGTTTYCGDQKRCGPTCWGSGHEGCFCQRAVVLPHCLSRAWVLKNRRLALRYDRLGFLIHSLLHVACIFLGAGHIAREF